MISLRAMVAQVSGAGCDKLDRLARSVNEARGIADELKTKGVSLGLSERWSLEGPQRALGIPKRAMPATGTCSCVRVPQLQSTRAEESVGLHPNRLCSRGAPVVRSTKPADRLPGMVRRASRRG